MNINHNKRLYQTLHYWPNNCSAFELSGLTCGVKTKWITNHGSQGLVSQCPTETVHRMEQKMTKTKQLACLTNQHPVLKAL